jgi:nucleoside-diphosphate-sugar epimerase
LCQAGDAHHSVNGEAGYFFWLLLTIGQLIISQIKSKEEFKMKKALVLGATGGMGYAIVQELKRRGVEVVAFSRGKEKLERCFSSVREHGQVTLFPGDAFRLEQLIEAAEGVDVIFHAVGLPYTEWEARLLILMDHVLQTAQRQGAKVAVVDNIYAYGRQTGERIREETLKQPQTKKGRIRLAVERKAKASSVPVLFAHFPDFYGPNATNTVLHHTLERVIRNKPTGFVGPLRVPREFIYTMDGATAIVELALTDKAYGQSWNIPGYDVIRGEDIIRLIREISGYDKPVREIGGGMIRFLGIWNRQMREMVEMLYLTQETIALSGEKYETEIGPLPRTPYHEGLRETLELMRRQAF